jgi:hypothetical protein
MEYLLADGTTSSVSRALANVASPTLNELYVAPANAIAAKVYLVQQAAGAFSISGVSLVRTSDLSPVNVIKIKDEYRSSSTPVEYINCTMRTKSYDYKVPTSYKRLFWWAADLKSANKVTSTLIPVAVKQSPTHADMKSYTHSQLHAGTWGNPLKFLQTVLDIQDGADPSNAQTENGRILMKFKKSIRFKQASFKLELTTFGNKATGPVKIHSLITFVQPKEKVTERTN